MVKYRKTDNQCEFCLAWRKKNKQLYIELFFLLYMSMYFLQVCICNTCVLKQKESVRLSEIVVMCGYEPSCMCWELKPDRLKEL